jgi:predicted nucleic acid-binding Zn ribbon protein
MPLIAQKRKARRKAAVPAPLLAEHPQSARPQPQAAIPRSPSGGRPRLAREVVLAQWRGVDLTPLEKAGALVAKRAGEVLHGLAPNLDLGRHQAVAELLKAWPHLVDPDVAAHAQPMGLRNRTLFVSVDSSVWLSDIVRYRYKDILDRLQQTFGRSLVTRISFRLG